MSHDVRLDIAWSESALVTVAGLRTFAALNDFIVTNNQRLGRLEQHAPSAWNELRRAMHAKDGELRAAIRKGVG